ncbi:MAG: type II toxin-antitoxin system HicB family antitoxin [Aggregatilineales bacterium]
MAMPETVHFRLERYDDDGVYYVIEGVELALVTDGRTIEEAVRHLRDVVELYYEDESGHVPAAPVLAGASGFGGGG